MTIEELSNLLAAAMQGPWYELPPVGGHTAVATRAGIVGGVLRIADAAAIVALRNHADALLAVARAAKAFRDANLAHGSEPTNVLDAAYDALTDALARLEATT